MSKRKIQKDRGFTQHHFFLNKKSGAGFTLVELLVVIAIIGILSGVVLTSMSSGRNRANDGRRISDIKNIQMALELYYDVNTAYPTDGGGDGTLYIVVLGKKPLDDYLKISKDPDGSNYKYWSDGQDYHLAAILQEYNKLITEDEDAVTNNFDGYTTDCVGTAATDDTERCYDVTP